MADTIAFLGLGSMGTAMATNLLKAGFSLTVYNRTAAKAEPLRQQGATVATTPAEAVREATIVFTMLTDDKALEEITTGPDGILSALPQGGGLLALLHQLRQELLAELAQQRQEAAAREATRTQELTQLRQQLAQAGQSATERQAEQEAKAALEQSLRTARAELATRNQELDARIQQLGQLLEQLHKTSPAATPSKALYNSPSVPAPLVIRSAPPRPAYRRLQQVERWGLVALAVGILGAGGFGLSRWLHPPKGKPLSTAPRHSARVPQPVERQAPEPVIVYDTLAAPQPTEDLGATRSPLPADDEGLATPALIIHDTPLHVDSATLSSEPAHLSAPADSAAASPTP